MFVKVTGYCCIEITDEICGGGEIIKVLVFSNNETEDE